MKTTPLILLCGLLFAATLARATPFVVNGLTYDISLQNLSWSNASDRALLEANPWFGQDYQTTLTFATTVGYSLGAQLPGSQMAPAWGPLFVYTANPYAVANVNGLGYQPNNLSPYQQYTFTFAVGHEVTSAVPDRTATAGLLAMVMVGLVAARRRMVRG